MDIVVLCNPENRRTEMFCEAAKGLRLPRPRLVSYNDVLDGTVKLSDFLTSSTLLRIESPGENFEVWKKIVGMELAPDHGRIRFLREWFLGFSDLLYKIENVIQASRCSVMNSPSAICLMFNKPLCQEHLNNCGIPVPTQLAPPRNYFELKQNCSRVFIKPSHASSASGVLAYRIQGDKEELITSVEMTGRESFYNSLKLRHYTNSEDIRVLVDFILNEGAVVEEWIPKASIDNKFFDLRIVVIDGHAKAVLPRLSSGPITNLHLGNQRGDLERVKELIGEENFDEALKCAERAVSCIDGALYAGVDVLITAGSFSPKVLEVNAFGDLLPGIKTTDGDDIYTSILKAALHEV